MHEYSHTFQIQELQLQQEKGTISYIIIQIRSIATHRNMRDITRFFFILNVVAQESLLRRNNGTFG